LTEGENWISLPAWTAEVFAILFHHCLQNLLSGVDAEFEERTLDAAERFQQWEWNLHSQRLGQLDDLEMIRILGLLGHGGGSFVGLFTPSVTREG